MLELVFVNYTGGVVGEGVLDAEAVAGIVPAGTTGGPANCTLVIVDGVNLFVQGTVAEVREKLEAAFEEDMLDDEDEV